MTINQYLYALEVFKLRRDNLYENYLRLLERASSPAAARIDPDGLPKARNYRNGHEDILIRVADAAAAYYKARNNYDAFYRQFDKNLSQLEPAERWALEIIYIDNMGKPRESRRAGVCKALGVRTKKEAGEVIRQAKQHLTEILRAQGIEIE